MVVRKAEEFPVVDNNVGLAVCIAWDVLKIVLVLVPVILTVLSCVFATCGLLGTVVVVMAVVVVPVMEEVVATDVVMIVIVLVVVALVGVKVVVAFAVVVAVVVVVVMAVVVVVTVGLLFMEVVYLDRPSQTMISDATVR